jgi:hypothetical protein
VKINREILVTIRWLATYSQSLAAPLVRAITSELTVKRMEYASAESEPCIGGILSLSSGARTINAKTNGHGKGGPSTGNEAAVYGILGIPALGNIPRGRNQAATWTDSHCNFWLFGGWGYDVVNQVRHYSNDLWKFNPSTNQWKA